MLRRAARKDSLLPCLPPWTACLGSTLPGSARRRPVLRRRPSTGDGLVLEGLRKPTEDGFLFALWQGGVRARLSESDGLSTVHPRSSYGGTFAGRGRIRRTDSASSRQGSPLASDAGSIPRLHLWIDRPRTEPVRMPVRLGS